ncbi:MULTISPECIES: ion transporter [unclassified Pseudoalteromonas]|uniref:ion transporter n=1 Tax=unclassified Pseudoalteromonas TaxID=194690 RepID=UPI000C06B51D|nr:MULTISPECIES: ion transporter [unclassified Pseudoalteromonas]MDB2355710.1 ion transporter [Pseudoalteromonas sp.]MDP2634936.1 ion transporter [Pseudoalteromonas sp. 1_MG-2023]PHN89179.1 voltage-gated potassium channel [Pseudoalteromonas sp. 3D05]
MDNKIFLDRPIFVWIITILILYSVFCFSLETLPNLSADTRLFLKYSEIVVVVIFTCEYFIRILLSPKRLRFIFSFYGLVDLIAILPFYLAFAIDLRSFRLIRLLRLIRVLKVARYNSALQRFSKALFLAKEELAIFTGLSLILLYLSAVGIYHFEHVAQPEVFKSIFDSLWWSVATLTTVGYGDIYPITIGGRFFTFIILMIGLGLVAVPTGIVASALSAARRQSESN